MKGFFDRLLLPGFAFKYRENSVFWDKLLQGKTAQCLVTMDTPPWYFRFVYGRPAHRQMKHSILGFCGIKLKRISEFSVMRDSSEYQRQNWLHRAKKLGVKAVA